MHKIIFLVIGLLLLAAGCVAIDESDIEGAQPDVNFGPASLFGMWKGESNWDGAVKEIFVMVRNPVLERMVTPTPQVPLGKLGGEHAESPIKSAKPGSHQTDKVVSPTPTAPAPVWKPITDTGLVFWTWDIFFKISEKAPCNVQIIFKEDGRGNLTVVSQGGGTGNARFVQDGSERRIEGSLAHPVFKEIKARILYNGNKINGSFTLLGKEGVFKLVKEKFEPTENPPPPKQ